MTRTVSSYTFVLVLPPQIGQCIHRDVFFEFIFLASLQYQTLYQAPDLNDKSVWQVQLAFMQTMCLNALHQDLIHLVVGELPGAVGQQVGAVGHLTQ